MFFLIVQCSQFDCDLEGEDAHVLVDVQFACPVKVEDGVEGPWMAIKEVLVLNEAVVSHKVHNLLVCLHSSQISQSGDIRNKTQIMQTEWTLVNLESGNCSKSFQVTSCLTPPTFRATLL